MSQPLPLGLTDDEDRELAEHEAAIERGLQTFIDVGLRLAAVRDKSLYRAEYATFADYCKRRWDLSVSRAYQLVNASAITREMSTIVDVELPATESQARELVGLTPDVAAQVMAETTRRVRGRVTAKAIRITRDRITGEATAKPPPPVPPAPPPETEDDPHKYCGDEGFIRQHALAAWDANPETPDMLLMEFEWWAQDFFADHFDCLDPFIASGFIASVIDTERNAKGWQVLDTLASAIAMIEYRFRKAAGAVGV